MAQDARGLELHGTDEAVGCYDRALDHLIRFRAQVTDAVSAAIAADPQCVMARVFAAYLALMSTEEGAVAGACDALGDIADDQSWMLPRERAHLAAARRWVAGDMAGTGDALNAISVEFPRDLLALMVGHQIDFFTGNAVNLRDRIGRALAGWHADDPQSGFVHGMYAFGLEECNMYRQSEKVGQQAVATNPDDVWALHAVVHTYEMEGRIPEGVRFMRDRDAAWTSGNFLNVHNSWHYALYLLQGGDTAGALQIYDRVLRPDGSQDAALELLDAAALLWRIELDGGSAGGRWEPLAAGWGRLLVPGFYPFNDMHAIMSYLGDGAADRAEDLVRDLEQVVAHGDGRSAGWQMTAAVGLPVCRSLLAFGRGDYAAAVAGLLPVRARVHEFGGSHAQRDVVERTLLEAAIRSGRLDLASALVSERLAVRECNSYAWTKRAWLMNAAGDRAGAASAMARARDLAGQIRAAAS